MAEGWNRDEQEEIRKIAQNAIESITKLSNIVERRNTNALTELQRRFPTTGGRNTASSNLGTASYPTSTSSRGSRSTRPSPYSRRTAGRPHELVTVSKDVVIIEYGKDKVPCRTEKVYLEKARRIISGFEVGREWTSTQLEKELTALLKGTEMEGFSFEIVKNCSGTLVKPNIPVGRRIDSKLLLKSIAPAGCIYMRLLAELPSDDDDDDVLAYSVFDRHSTSSISPATSTITAPVSQSTSSTSTATVSHQSTVSPSTLSPSTMTSSAVQPTNLSLSSSRTRTAATVDLTNDNTKEANGAATGHHVKCPFDINAIISSAKTKELVDPVEVLRFLQDKIVLGRKLDVVSTDEECEGETNYINVDRERALFTTFSELEYMDNYRFTFKVGFMGEDVVDLGGPRREWIRLVNREIKAKYFDQGLRQYLANEYFYVGIMMALAMLQNGPMPAFIKEEILNIILSPSQTSDPCVKEIKAGLEMLGMLSALQQLPMLHHLLRPNSQHSLTVPKLLQFLKPKFSEEGSNAQKYEKEIYQHFVKFVREVASGLRSCGDEKLQLSHILAFVTGSAEEPVLGFALDPSIEFVKNEVNTGFAPTAHTCGNILNIPVPSIGNPLPAQKRLFNLYDLVFSQSYFGKM